MEKFTFTIEAAGINREHAEDLIKNAIVDAINSEKICKVDSQVKWDKFNDKRQRLLDMADSIRSA